MWKYKGKEVTKASQLPKNALGFIYNIHNTTKNKNYIGKKNLYCWKKVSLKVFEDLKAKGEEVKRHKNKSTSKKGEPVWVYQVRVEGPWTKYCGSNEELKADIKKGDKITKEIIGIAFCTKQLTYLEIEAQIKMDVLRNPDKFYNQNILGKFWPNDLTC